MNKKMENLVTYLFNRGSKRKLNPVAHAFDGVEGKYFVTDGCAFVVLTATETLPAVMNSRLAEKMANILWDAVQGKNGDLTAHDLPPVETIKAECGKIRGRKRFPIGCRLAEDFPALNAEYIIKGMEALTATKLFFVDGNMNAPVMLFRDDEPWNAECLLVLPIYCHKTGYWEQPE